MEENEFKQQIEKLDRELSTSPVRYTYPIFLLSVQPKEFELDTKTNVWIIKENSKERKRIEYFNKHTKSNFKFVFLQQIDLNDNFGHWWIGAVINSVKSELKEIEKRLDKGDTEAVKDLYLVLINKTEKIVAEKAVNLVIFIYDKAHLLVYTSAIGIALRERDKTFPSSAKFWDALRGVMILERQKKQRTVAISKSGSNSCWYCFKQPVDRECGTCHRASYCSISCQYAHWDFHRVHCVPLKKAGHSVTTIY